MIQVHQDGLSANNFILACLSRCPTCVVVAAVAVAAVAAAAAVVVVVNALCVCMCCLKREREWAGQGRLGRGRQGVVRWSRKPRVKCGHSHLT